MKRPLFFAGAPVLLFAFSSAQVAGRGIAAISDNPRMTTPEANRDTIFLSGKVIVDDGTPLSGPAAIQTICDGKRRTETYTDRHGSFSFRFGDQRSSSGTGLGDASITSNSQTSTQFLHNLRDCELQAVLPGFASEIIVLNSKIIKLESTDLGKLELHRLNRVEGLTVSATSVTAPDAARRALEKSFDRERRNKWNEAQELLQKAVEIYPKYAVAWFELGLVQAHQNDVAGARHSFEQAATVDPKYVSPYQGLAQLAARVQHWQELVETTNKILELNPVSFPDAWFFNGVGYYYLHDFGAAEKSAREGLKLDEEHRIPKLEYLLAMALMQRRDYAEAAEHMRQYLRLATTPSETAEAQKELSEIGRLAAAAGISVSGDNK
jgi:hypothetical protein